MKFITKNRDRFDLHIPKTEVIVASKFTNVENFQKKLVKLINLQYENIFSNTLTENGFDIVKFSYNENCNDLSENEFGFILKNTFYIVEYDLVYDSPYHISGIAKIVYKVYRLVFYFQLLRGAFPFKFIENETTEYKFIKIDLSPAEVREMEMDRDLPF